ncbi:MAG TPA: peptidase E [Kineosporiaceae bacterium]
MTADAPTILATSGGLVANPEGRRRFDLGPLILHAVELSGVHGRAPRVLYVGTAMGDPRTLAADLDEASRAAGIVSDHLHLFPMPNHDDIEGVVLGHDVVWVGGGSVANLLAVWRIHALDAVFRKAWEAGVVLAGVSAGSICWHAGGTTDSFGPELQPVTNGLALLPWGNGVHYDSERRRRPLVRRLVSEGLLPRTYCTDDGVGIVYRGTEVVEVVSEHAGPSAYLVERDAATGKAVEILLPARVLS